MVGAPAGATPAGAVQTYEAMRAQRRELGRQLESLEEKREDLSSQLQDPMIAGANRTGIEQRIAEIDQRISAVDQAIAAADAEVARSAAVPGAVVDPRPMPPSGPPEEVFVLAVVFMLVVLLPLSIAYSRRIWRRGATVVTSIPKEITAQLSRLEQAVESIALEVERIGEGQRFMARVMTEQGAPRALGEGAAEPIATKARSSEEVRR